MDLDKEELEATKKLNGLENKTDLECVPKRIIQLHIDSVTDLIKDYESKLKTIDDNTVESLQIKTEIIVLKRVKQYYNLLLKHDEKSK